ncbi:PREDICTED: junctophilin-3-like isoform X2 [Amphimedon queenslandica]|uniref:Junctophilin n=1 Tax=Amphimedon queenslandica TaxID=400682 RepID=A0AAN0JE97_AMPQE|nr:PREDICTED: junctophilin-3-like isoform X2 [Amphimedon queenslandica]|eukprot:XP_019855077.1 PREDICTED: junctophilin-3-like isoform X2 [Amphimedon queenslandica]
MSEEEDKRPTRGLFDFSDGGRYQGEWFCGGAHGYGVCSLPGDGGSSFEGYWEEGSQKSGVFTWSSGHKYIGTWQDGMRHGLGKELRPDGTEYLGDFSSNVRGPNGVLKLSNGALYQGTWSDGLQDGIGVEIYADKGVYKGQYKKGQRNGYGTRSSSNYEVYSKLMQPRESQTTDIIASSVAPSSSPTISHSSSFRVSKGSNPTQLQTGPSVSSLKYVAEPTTDSDTQIYEGQWEKDKREGHGILKIPGRYSYLGQWKNNGRSGYGVVLHENGRKDEGLWEEGKLVLPLKRKRLSYKHHQLETKVKAAHTAALQAADVARTKSILAESRSLGVVKRSNAASVSAQKAEEDAAKAKEVSQSLSGDSGTKATGKLHSSFPTPTDFNLSNRDTCISTPADSLLSVPVLSSASSFEDMASLQDHDENLKPNLSSSSCSGSDIEGEEKASMFDCDTVSVQSDPCGGISIKVSEEEEEEFKPVRDLSSRSKRASVPSSARSRHSISSYDANKSKSKSFFKQHRLLEEDEGEEREGEEAQMETVRRRLSHMNAPRVDQSEVTNLTDTDDETHETGRFGKPDHLSRQASLAGSSQFQQSPLQQSLNMDMLTQMVNWNKTVAYINFILLMFLLLLIVILVAFLTTNLSQNNPASFMNHMA